VSYKPVACSCWEYCPVCAGEPLTADALATHNRRVACHGERDYPAEPVLPHPFLRRPEWLSR